MYVTIWKWSDSMSKKCFVNDINISSMKYMTKKFIVINNKNCSAQNLNRCGKLCQIFTVRRYKWKNKKNNFYMDICKRIVAINII